MGTRYPIEKVTLWVPGYPIEKGTLRVGFPIEKDKVVTRTENRLRVQSQLSTRLSLHSKYQVKTLAHPDLEVTFTLVIFTVFLYNSNSTLIHADPEFFWQ